MCKLPDALVRLGISENEELLFEPMKDHAAEWAGFTDVESYADYYEAVQCYIRTVALSFAERGVKFHSLDGVMISPFAQIGAGTVIFPNVQIRHGVTIGKNCVIGSGSIIENSTIGDDCVINATQIYQSVLDRNVKIGPFCHVRPNSHLCEGVKIGDFVEVKNSTVGKDTHASHLTYIGDSDVGERVNFGCGTVTVNYDGKRKFRTVIGNDAFIGCNTNLVAPVHIGDHGYTAAGSTITDDVPASSLGIARARQVNKNGWVTKKNQSE
ncbi:MAG: UDP-N-acetylglucosamine diphosphorylase [Ruminococcaceae bacterium]|nr:UDP-N-acetylglucosamine diphosphorylase [Oscillospiraceae bacterium]